MLLMIFRPPTAAVSPPVADFSGAPLSGFAPLLVQFTDLSTGNPDTWIWDFGDGHTSTDQNPSHFYAVAGTYSPSLTVSNAFGSDELNRPDYITVTQNAPVANFTGTPLSGPVPLTVVFTDSSTDADFWLWNFGDLGTSTSQNPSHTYYISGTFTVSLTVTNSSGSDTLTRTEYVVVSAPTGHACDWNSPAAAAGSFRPNAPASGDWSVPVHSTGTWASPRPDC